MSLKSKAKKVGLIGLASLVGAMPLQAKEIPVSRDKQEGYEKLQEGRLDRQTLKCLPYLWGNDYVGWENAIDNEVNAAFIDAFVGNNDWITSAKEKDDFLDQSEGNDIFYVVVESVKPNATREDTFVATNNPLDYICLVTKKNVFSTKKGAEREINKRLKERESVRRAGMSTQVIGNGGIGYIEVYNHKSENRPYTVNSFFGLYGDRFVEQNVLGYSLSEKRAKPVY